jgi:hypothetical protein
MVTFTPGWSVHVPSLVGQTQKVKHTKFNTRSQAQKSQTQNIEHKVKYKNIISNIIRKFEDQTSVFKFHFS